MNMKNNIITVMMAMLNNSTKAAALPKLVSDGAGRGIGDTTVG
uniref:Uncharacterized protein n=1 Tax=Pithovirus LCPAC103 TaxID=2506588 RepID=A0A481Z5J5_9VIRU|nr:MAG: hypothetical protein LCPAC103_00700 [Pithovirus LCPAC103]